jgi:hypothetical protein
VIRAAIDRELLQVDFSDVLIDQERLMVCDVNFCDVILATIRQSDP